MRKYHCYYELKCGDSHQTVEAESPEDALRIFTESNPNIEYPMVTIEWGWGILGINSFQNPNYVAPKISTGRLYHHSERVSRPVVEKVKESRPEQPTKPDGSVGWYENLGESVLSDRDFLIAQLHELRTIKRCVVCTILIVIVIPVVFGVIAFA